MDRVFLHNLRVDCVVGLTSEERRTPQKVVLDVDLYLDLSAPASSELIDETVDYREARSKVSEFVSRGEFTLLESLADGLASLLLDYFELDRVVVRARKEKYSEEPSMGVEVERAKGD